MEVAEGRCGDIICGGAISWNWRGGTEENYYKFLVQNVISLYAKQEFRGKIKGNVWFFEIE